MFPVSSSPKTRIGMMETVKLSFETEGSLQCRASAHAPSQALSSSSMSIPLTFAIGLASFPRSVASGM
jgi:hypothetical protein